jgi:diguanylate cyclase (GGDEF)-like protein
VEQGETMTQTAVEQKSLRDKLRQAFAKAKMPTSPGVATRILALANDPNSSFEHFSDAIRMDAALAARVIKLANGAHYGQSSGVTTIPRAVALLGMSQVRAAALGFQLVGHLNKLGGCPFDMKAYWQHSVLRACLMRIVAKKVTPKLEEEAFLVGLLQDCGILLLVQLLGSQYAEFFESCNLSPTAFFLEEKNRFPHNHVEACTTIATEWNLPEAIVLPISKHHAPIRLDDSSSMVERLCGVSYLVGSMRFTSNVAFDSSEPELLEYASKNLKLSAADLAECLEQTAAAYAHMAEMMGNVVPEDVDVTEILSEANRQLTLVAGDATQRVHHFEAEREQVLRNQTQLQSALGEYRERAARDPLTGIFNRGALVDGAMAILSTACEQGSAVSAFFIDIDNFKMLNDRYGHATGDAVLIAVARTIATCAVNAGCAGRYGGEEFVLFQAGLSEPQARNHAEHVVKQVRTIDFNALGLESAVTCSVGATWSPATACNSSEELMNFADSLMYEAKRSGKDKACFRLLHTADEALGKCDPATAQLGNTPSRTISIPSVAETVDFDAALLKANAAAANQNVRMRDERKHPRKEMGYPCKAFCLNGKPPKTTACMGRVRNLSAGGASLLIAHTVRRGEAVEVQLQLPDKPTVFLGGIASFCRHIEGRVYEVGLQLITQSSEPIFSANPVAAVARLEWLANSLEVSTQ